uniref:Uncharacterized protein n=1 Tax=Ascaris lumbricoides TaxID=6252 RepID=A0A0M3IEQ5_ASCLU
MSARSDAEKENERKEKRVSVDSPSTLLSPASKVLHKKVYSPIHIVCFNHGLSAFPSS